MDPSRYLPDPDGKRHPLLRLVNIIVGSVLVILGLLGLVFPVLQGLLFLALGLAFLSAEIPILRRLRRRYGSRLRGWWRRRRGEAPPEPSRNGNPSLPEDHPPADRGEEGSAGRSTSSVAALPLFLLLAAPLAVTVACLSTHVEGSGLARQREVSVTARILSEPPGATVRDVETGRVLGRTPLEVDAFTLVFEDWRALNRPGEREELLEETRRRPGGYALAGTDKAGTPLRARAEEPFLLQYRLEMPGRQTVVVSREIAPESLPGLEESPLVVLRASLPPSAGDE